jgi:Ni,Fe-hydrogenase III large subunit/Ni,Fe-hydrogenase III component G
VIAPETPRGVDCVEPSELGDRIAALVADGGRVLTFVGTDDRAARGAFGLHAAVLTSAGRTVDMAAWVDARDPRYLAATPRVPALQWDERELHDLLGVVPEGHPDPRRLVLRDEWPAGLYPLRKDFHRSRVPPLPERDTAQPRVVEGDEVVEIPVGPIHAGIIEPGHFRFSAVGETILNLDAQLFYTHRGIEKSAEGRTPQAALFVAERTCGACAVSHAVAFATACEEIAGREPPPRARWGRAVLLELERLYNHLGDAGNMCGGGAFVPGVVAGAHLKERVQRRLEHLVGHRFGRGAVALGGLRRDLPAAEVAALAADLPGWRADTRRFADLVLSGDGIVDRMRRTGVLSGELVRALGGVGVAARASGVDTDLRRDRPYGAYPDLALSVPIQAAGDAEARFRQRVDEATVTLRLLEQLCADAPAGPVAAPVERVPAGVGLGAVESPRGACVHWVRVDADGLVDRLRIRSASFANWPLVPLTAPGNLVPDFPMINKSFELCYACLDR